MCNQCEAATINGVYCHEQGCPDTWTTELRDCKWCGNEFKPDYDSQSCCSQDCLEAYNQ